MKLHELRDNPGATKPKKRIGRGPGSGHGKTAGRGFSDQHADFWSADGHLLAVSQQVAWYDLPE